MLMRQKIGTSQRIKEMAHHEAGHCIMELYAGITPRSVVLRQTDGHTINGDLTQIQDFEYDLIVLAGTAAEHLYQGKFPQLLSQVLDGGIPHGSQSDWSKLKNPDPVCCFEKLLAVRNILIGERWIVLQQAADELFDRRELNSADIAGIAKKLSAAYHNSKQLMRIERLYLDNLKKGFKHRAK